jgi:hypothetical protein
MLNGMWASCVVATNNLCVNYRAYSQVVVFASTRCINRAFSLSFYKTFNQPYLQLLGDYSDVKLNFYTQSTGNNYLRS